MGNQQTMFFETPAYYSTMKWGLNKVVKMRVKDQRWEDLPKLLDKEIRVVSAQTMLLPIGKQRTERSILHQIKSNAFIRSIKNRVLQHYLERL